MWIECTWWDYSLKEYDRLKTKLYGFWWSYENKQEVLQDEYRLKKLWICNAWRIWLRELNEKIDDKTIPVKNEWESEKGLSWLKKEAQKKEIISWNENIDKLLLSKITDFLVWLEWFIKISKWDHWQYSWWYSTKAPKWGLEISKEKAMIELQKKINNIFSSLNKEKWFPGLNENQKIALISFFYNVGLTKKWKENLMYRLRNWYLKAATNMMLEYKYTSWKHNEWLLSRRKKEVNKFWS